MPTKKSFVLSATFPSSKNSLEELKEAIELIRPFDFSTIEYYCDRNSNVNQVRRILDGYRSVFLGAALQKSSNLSLCTPIASDRKKALEELSECCKFAEQTGADSILINSGKRPQREEHENLYLNYLRDSICELHQKVSGIKILLEPGDRDIEYFHLIGHTEAAVSFIKNIRNDVPSISLVFDISHIAQLSENLYSSWEIAREYCSHVHLANCVLDIDSPLYGDKHPLFSVKNGIYTHESAAEFYNYLQKETGIIDVGIEVICTEASEREFFNRFVSETEWFF